MIGGGNLNEGGSGEQDDARDTGLLSNDAFVREGVGGSTSECKSGEGDREGEGGLEGYGEVGGVSNNGRNANRGFWRCGVGRAGRRWARWGGCHCCGAGGACLVLGGGEKREDQLGVGEGEVTGEELCDDEEDDESLLFSARRGKSPMGTAER